MGESFFETIGNVISEASERGERDRPEFRLNADILRTLGVDQKGWTEARSEAYRLFDIMREQRPEATQYGPGVLFRMLRDQARKAGTRKAEVFFDALHRQHEAEQGQATSVQHEDTPGLNAALGATRAAQHILSAREFGLDKLTTKPLAEALQATGLAKRLGIQPQWQGWEGVQRAEEEADYELHKGLVGRAAMTGVNIYAMMRGIKGMSGLGVKAISGKDPSRLAKLFAATVGAKGVLPTGGRLSTVANSMARFGSYEAYRGLSNGIDQAFARISQDPSKWPEVLGEVLGDTAMSAANGAFFGSVMPATTRLGQIVGARLSGLASKGRDVILQKSIMDILKEGGAGSIKNAARVAVGRFAQGFVEGVPNIGMPQFSGTLRPNDPNSAETIIQGFLGGIPLLFSDDPKQQQRGYEAVALNTIFMGLWSGLNLKTPIGDGLAGAKRERAVREIAQRVIDQRSGTPEGAPEQGAAGGKKKKPGYLNLSDAAIHTLGSLTPREYRIIVDSVREALGAEEYAKLPEATRTMIESNVLHMVTTIDLVNKKRDPKAPSILEGLRARAREAAMRDMDDLYKLDFRADELEQRLRQAASDPAKREEAILLKAELDNVRHGYLARAKTMGPEFAEEALKMATAHNAERRQLAGIEDLVAKLESMRAQDPENYALTWFEAVEGRGDFNEGEMLKRVIDNDPRGLLGYLLRSSPDWQTMGREALRDPAAVGRIIDHVKRGVQFAKQEHNQVAERIQGMAKLAQKIREDIQTQERAKVEKKAQAEAKAAAKENKRRLLGRKRVVTEPDGSKKTAPASPDEKPSDVTLYLNKDVGTKLATATRLMNEGGQDSPEFKTLYAELSKEPSIKGMLDAALAGKVELAEEKRKHEATKYTDPQSGFGNRAALEALEARLELEQRAGIYKSDEHQWVKVDLSGLSLDNLIAHAEGDKSMAAAFERIKKLAALVGVTSHDVFRAGERSDEMLIHIGGKGAKKRAALFMEQLKALGDLREPGKTPTGETFTRTLVAGTGATKEIADADYRKNQRDWKISEVKAGRTVTKREQVDKEIQARTKKRGDGEGGEGVKRAPRAPRQGPPAKKPGTAAPDKPDAPKVVGQAAPKKTPTEPKAMKAEEVGKDADYPDDISDAELKTRINPLKASIRLLTSLETENPGDAQAYRARAAHLRERLQKAEARLATPPTTAPAGPTAPTRPKSKMTWAMDVAQAKAQAALKSREATTPDEPTDISEAPSDTVAPETANEPPSTPPPEVTAEPPPPPPPTATAGPAEPPPPPAAAAAAAKPPPPPRTFVGRMIAKYLKRARGKAVPTEVIQVMRDALDMAEAGHKGAKRQLESTSQQGLEDVNPLDVITLATPEGAIRGVVLAVGGRSSKGQIAQGSMPGRRIVILTKNGIVSRRISDVISHGPEDAATLAETLHTRATEDGFVEIGLDNFVQQTSAFVDDLYERQQMAERGTGRAPESTRRRKWLFGLRPAKKGGHFEPRQEGDKFVGRAFEGYKVKTGKDGTRTRVAKMSDERELTAMEIASTEAAARAKRIRDGDAMPEDYALEALAALYDDAMPFTKPVPKRASRGRDALAPDRETREDAISRLWLKEASTTWYFDPTGRPMDLKSDEVAALAEQTRAKSNVAQEWIDQHPIEDARTDEQKMEWFQKHRESQRYDRYMRNRQLWASEAEIAERDHPRATRRAQQIVWVSPETPEQLSTGEDGLVVLRAYDHGGRRRDIGMMAVRLGDDSGRTLVFRNADAESAQNILRGRGVDADLYDYIDRRSAAVKAATAKGPEAQVRIVADRDADGHTTTMRLADDVVNDRMRKAVDMISKYALGQISRKEMETEGFRPEHLDAVDAWMKDQQATSTKDFARSFQDWFMHRPKRAPRAQAEQRVSPEGVIEEQAVDPSKLAGELLPVDESADGIGIRMVQDAEAGLDPITGRLIVRSEKVGNDGKKEIRYRLQGPNGGITLMSVSPFAPWIPGASKSIGRAARWLENRFLDSTLEWTWDTGVGLASDIGEWLVSHALAGLSKLPGFSPAGFSKRWQAMKDWLHLALTDLDGDGRLRDKMNELYGRTKAEEQRFMDTLEGLMDKSPEELLRMFVAHDAGDSQAELEAYQKFADELMDYGIEHGWFSKDDVGDLRGRYIPRSRWLMNERTHSMFLEQLRGESARFNNRLQDQLAKVAEARAKDRAPEVIKRLVHDAKALERALKRVNQLVKRTEKLGPQRFDRMKMEVRGRPTDSLSSIRELVKLRASGRLIKRRVETLAEIIGNGNLDTRQPLYLLIDGIIPEVRARVAADWWREVAQDPAMAKDVASAPRNWVEVTLENAIGDPALEPLIGKAIHPQLMDWYQISRPTEDGPVRSWMRHLENSIKLTLTAYNPANWVTQMIGNSAMMLGAGISFTQIASAQTNGFLASFGRGKWGKNFKKYLRLNFVDVPSDADRDFIRDLEKHYGASIIEARHPMEEFKSALAAAMEGKWRVAGQALDVGSAQTARRLLRVYRMLDGAARIGTYETLIENGMSEAEARKMVYSLWDVTNVSRWTKYSRRAFFLGNSFASIAHTMFRNPKMVYKGTVKGTLGLMLMSQLANAVWAMLLNKNRDEMEEEIANSVPQYGDFSRWWQTKTAFWTPWGVINLGKYLPLGTALDYLPGLRALFFGGRDEQGQTFWGDVANKLAGGGNVLLQPTSEYVRNRDRFGNAVQHRYDIDNPLGWSMGLLKENIKNGVVPMAMAKALSPYTGVLTQPGAQALFVGRPTQVVSRAIDSTSRYNVTSMGQFDDSGILRLDPKRTHAERDTAAHYILRSLGLFPSQPSFTRRTLERASNVPGVQKGDKGAYELTPRALKEPQSDRSRAAVRAVDQASQASTVERGLLLLGMLKALDDGDGSAMDDIRERFKNLNGIESARDGLTRHSPLMSQQIWSLMKKHQIYTVFGRLPGAREVRGR